MSQVFKLLLVLVYGCSVLLVSGQQAPSPYCQARPVRCTLADVWPMRDDCTRYYRCNGAGKWKTRSCNRQRVFDVTSLTCTNRNRATCLNCEYAEPADPACDRPSPCKSNDRLPDPNNCHRYYVCDYNRWLVQDCAPGTKYDKARKLCDHVTNTAIVCQLPCANMTTVTPELISSTTTLSSTASSLTAVLSTLQSTTTLSTTTTTTTTPAAQESRPECSISNDSPCSAGSAKVLPRPGDCQLFYACIGRQWRQGNCLELRFDSVTNKCTSGNVTCSPPCPGASEGPSEITTTIATTASTTKAAAPPNNGATCRDVTLTMPLEELCNSPMRTDHSSCKFDGVVLIHTHPEDCRRYFVCAGANYWQTGACAPLHRFDPATCSCQPHSRVPECPLRCQGNSTTIDAIPSTTSATSPTTLTTTPIPTTTTATTTTTTNPTTSTTTTDTTTPISTTAVSTTTSASTTSTTTSPTTTSTTSVSTSTSSISTPSKSSETTTSPTSTSTTTSPPSTTTILSTTSSYPTSTTTSMTTSTTTSEASTTSTARKVSLTSQTATVIESTSKGLSPSPTTSTASTTSTIASTSSTPTAETSPASTIMPSTARITTTTTATTTGRTESGGLTVSTTSTATHALVDTPNTSADTSSTPFTPSVVFHPSDNITKGMIEKTVTTDTAALSSDSLSTRESTTASYSPTTADVLMTEAFTDLNQSSSLPPLTETSTLVPDTTTQSPTQNPTSSIQSKQSTDTPTSTTEILTTLLNSVSLTTGKQITTDPISSVRTTSILTETDGQTVPILMPSTETQNTSPSSTLSDPPPSGVPPNSTTAVLEVTSDMISTASLPPTTTIAEMLRSCLPEVASGLGWPETPIGRTYHLDCPGGRKGKVSRACHKDAGMGARWSVPDFQFCVDKPFQVLVEKVDTLAGAPTFQPVTSRDLMRTTARLARLTDISTTPLRPGNLNASVLVLDVLSQLTEAANGSDAVQLSTMTGVASNLLSPRNDRGWSALQKRDPSRSVTLMGSVDRIGQTAAAAMPPGQRTISSENLDIRIDVMPKEDATKFEFTPGNQRGASSGDSMRDQVVLEKATVDALGEMIPGENVAIWSTYFRTLHELLPVEQDEIINSKILSVSVQSLPDGARLSPPIRLHFTSFNTSATKYDSECSFWEFAEEDMNGGRWSDEGCETVFSNSTGTVCACKHLTNFAVLLSPHHATGVHASILRIISVVGCLISILGMLATICLYVLSWKRIKSHHAAVLINLCIALILANVTFLAGIDRTETKVICTVVAALLHYFFLAAFFIMFAEGVQFILYVVQVFHVRRKRETLLLLLTSWILPGVIVGITLSITRGEGYGTEDYCWIRKETGLIAAFAVPALIVIIANFFILCKILHTIAHSKGSEKTNRVKATVWNIAVMMPLLGMTWIFGFFSVGESTIAFQYIFAVCNSLQGFFIFFFHCVLNKKMRQAVAERFSSRYSQSSSLRKSGGSSKSQKKKESAKQLAKRSTRKEVIGHLNPNPPDYLTHSNQQLDVLKTMERQQTTDHTEQRNTYDQTNFTEHTNNFNYLMNPTLTKRQSHYQQNSPKVNAKDRNRQKSNQSNLLKPSEISDDSRSSLYNYKYNTKEKGNAYIVLDPEYMEIGPPRSPVEEEAIYMSIDNFTYPSSESLRSENDCR